MALQIGTVTCTTGMSKRIYDAIIGGVNTGMSSPLTVDQQQSLQALCYGIACGVVQEIQANGATSTLVAVDALASGVPASATYLTGTVG